MPKVLILPKICTKYSQSMHKVCTKYFQRDGLTAAIGGETFLKKIHMITMDKVISDSIALELKQHEIMGKKLSPFYLLQSISMTTQ